MSEFSVISQISLELRRQIFGALETTPDTDFNLSGIDDLSLLSPGETLPESAVASLYLYHLDIDKHLRNQRPLPDADRDDLFHRPPLPLQLRYLFTPVADEEDFNQLILGRVLQHFHDAPQLVTLGGTPIGTSRGAASPQIRIKPDMLSLEQMAQIWNAFSQPYRAALGFLVEVVAVDSGQPPVRRARVEELIPGIGQGGAGG